MAKRKIILDCDPGIDDSVALLVAAAHREELELLAVTTVSGNLGIDIVTENALRLVDFLKLNVPVARGAEAPIIREPVLAGYFHGENGLGGIELPSTDQKPVSENAVVYLAKLLTELPEGEKVTLVPTGPLTNIGLLLKAFPQVKEKIEQIVLMGGAMCGGNTTASAEFNIYVDPEAAKIVFDSKIPVVMCGLDVTYQCYLERNQIAKLCQSGRKVAGVYGDMLGFSLGRKMNMLTSRVCIHDAVTLAYLLHPDWFKGEMMLVDVDCSDSPSRGRTICDNRWWNYDEEDCHVNVLTYGDTKKFQEFIIDAAFEADSAWDS